MEWVPPMGRSTDWWDGIEVFFQDWDCPGAAKWQLMLSTPGNCYLTAGVTLPEQGKGQAVNE